MAESELKLDVACPRCGTSNMPAAHKCRQCFQDLSAIAPPVPDNAPPPGLFDFPRAALTCPACGKTNTFSLDTCVDCGASMAGGRPPSLEQVIAPTRLRKAVRARRKHEGAPGSPALFNLAWLLRLASVIFLFWGVIDTSFWLDKLTRGMAPEDPTIIRYSLFAIYEIVRNAAIVGGVWLLTLLKPRR
ncbi:MAG: Double zinc ribbon [Cyanobacteria bacterium RYN_339]|nr:Double zinc ribbon [Cyanobacteria bacterium RYN_339]